MRQPILHSQICHCQISSLTSILDNQWPALRWLLIWATLASMDLRKIRDKMGGIKISRKWFQLILFLKIENGMKCSVLKTSSPWSELIPESTAHVCTSRVLLVWIGSGQTNYGHLQCCWYCRMLWLSCRHEVDFWHYHIPDSETQYCLGMQW